MGGDREGESLGSLLSLTLGIVIWDGCVRLQVLLVWCGCGWHGEQQGEQER